MKRILALSLTVILLCSCADKTVKTTANTGGGISESEPTVSAELVQTEPVRTEPTQTEIIDQPEETTEQSPKSIFEQFRDGDIIDSRIEYLKDEFEFNLNYWKSLYEDLENRSDSDKEVTTFADNTSIYYRTGFHKVSCDFGALSYTVEAPSDWSQGLRYYQDYYLLENTPTGMAIYDGEIPVMGKITGVYADMIFLDAAGPMERSIFFLGQTLHGGLPLSIPNYISKFDHETYVDRKGRTLQVYYLDGLPKCACYDGYPYLFIWFNLKSEEQIPIAVYMVDSVEISLSWDAEIALREAERFGYTIIPPLNADY